MGKPQNTVGTSTFEKIKKDIIFGELAPGVKLKLDTLKGRYSASVSTLRETLNRLASEGFVDAEEQRGFFVTQVSREDLIEITNLRKNACLRVTIRKRKLGSVMIGNSTKH